MSWVKLVLRGLFVLLLKEGGVSGGCVGGGAGCLVSVGGCY